MRTVSRSLSFSYRPKQANKPSASPAPKPLANESSNSSVEARKPDGGSLDAHPERTNVIKIDTFMQSGPSKPLERFLWMPFLKYFVSVVQTNREWPVFDAVEFMAGATEGFKAIRSSIVKGVPSLSVSADDEIAHERGEWDAIRKVGTVDHDVQVKRAVLDKFNMGVCRKGGDVAGEGALDVKSVYVVVEVVYDVEEKTVGVVGGKVVKGGDSYVKTSTRVSWASSIVEPDWDVLSIRSEAA